MLQTAEKAASRLWSGQRHEGFAQTRSFSHQLTTGLYIEKIEQALDGSWSTGDGQMHWPGNTWKGMADNYLVLSDFENMPADVKAAAEDAQNRVINGHNIFTGPIKDNKGNVVVKAGEALDDGGLWEKIFFYAEGIQGEMPG